MELLSVSGKTLNLLHKDNDKIMKHVQQKGSVEIKQTKEGNLELEGEGGTVWIASQVLKALDFGFLPQQAYKLFGDNYFLEIIDMEIVLSNPKAIERYKGRVIGSEGRSKRIIQELSGAFIAVSGNKIAVLGEYDDLQLAKEAVLRLLEGAQHTGVFAYLEKKNRERKCALQ
ncbi:MAG: KH domain-containing protein [Candidatus Micrarchaeota archaeon]